ncbi:Tm-1-like ATP-binding domain-containing protein [Microbispora sp. GKU 823]|uniref:Tm-1-like ATP-binding domain-containing protein n=1 Tax=Microbispora sp. GKU 823 TaxID=1652100 RepID=UPI00277B524B|nr:Tm-1-like ATP-binding domain-containing protein [Microbispora sp. GKU 823]
MIGLAEPVTARHPRPYAQADDDREVAVATVVLLGTLDTKTEEYRWVRDRLRDAGCDVLLINVGTFAHGAELADIGADEVARAAGTELDRLRDARDRGAAMDAMATGAAVIVRRLFDEGRLDGLLAIGGSSGSSVAARALQALPVGVPKLLVSTMASGDVGPYVGDVDVTLMYSVVDISGINRLSRAVLGNAAAAAAGMAQRYARVRHETAGDERKLVAATMFGLTTPAVDEARDYLTSAGYEVLVFHATGSGGRAMEALAASGMLDGVLDLTTTELADDLVGGVLTAGPHRLEAAGRAGIPQVVSVGALDMVNFGPRDTVPEKFADRKFLVHNPTVTLMRTTREEMAELGARIGGKLSRATGPVEVYLPLKGVSGIDVEGGPFADPDADAACFAALRDGLKDTGVPVHDVDAAINDPGFGRAAAEALHRLISARRTGG